MAHFPRALVEVTERQVEDLLSSLFAELVYSKFAHFVASSVWPATHIVVELS